MPSGFRKGTDHTGKRDDHIGENIGNDYVKWFRTFCFDRSTVLQNIAMDRTDPVCGNVISLGIFQCSGDCRWINVETECIFRTVQQQCGDRKNTAATAGIHDAGIFVDVASQGSHAETCCFVCSGTESRTRLNQKNRIVFVCNFRCRLPRQE